MPRVVHFEIHADDPQRAVKFYEDAFGWQISKWEGPMDYWLVRTGPDNEMGINGGITPRSQGLSTVNTIGVDNLEAYMERVTKNGGKVLTDIMEIPGVGRMVTYQDTEGNIGGILQPFPM